MALSKRGPCWAAIALIAALLVLPAQPAAAADTAGPQVTLTAPTGSVSGVVGWSATASDPSGVERVELLVDGAILETDRSAPYGGLWDTTRWFYGPHSVSARAYDSLGNKSSATSTVSVNNLLGSVISDPQRFGVLGSDLLSSFNLSQQVNEANRSWSSYFSTDAPEGAFYASLQAGATALPGTLNLPQTLQPGPHYVFVKGYNYGTPINLRLAIGGGVATVGTADRDANGIWSVAVPITTQVPSSQLTLTVLKGGPAQNPVRFLFRGLYVTNDAQETVLKPDSVIKLSADDTNDDRSPRQGNLVENSSFETGLGHGWGLGENRLIGLKSVWDPTVGYHGGASVKLPLNPSAHSYGSALGLLSKAYALKPNKKYTLSAWVRADPGAQVSGALSLVNAFSDNNVLPEGYPPQHRLAKGFTAGPTWTQVSVSGYVRAYPTADYEVEVLGDENPGRHLWVDAVSLTEGLPVIYTPRLPLEIGLVSAQSSNLYYDDEQVLFKLRVANGSSAGQSGTVRYEVYDYMNRNVKSGSVSVSAAAATTHVRDLRLGTGKRGSFRVVLWLDGVEGSEEEVLFGVVPRPQVAGADPGSSIGIHSSFAGFQYDALSKLGVKWDRAMSPGDFFRWTDVEPQDDQFIWHDGEVDLARSRGIQIMGTIGGVTTLGWPAWADDAGKPNLDEWQEFVGQIVAHYRGRVAAWEIWNEPQSIFQPDFYAKVLKRAAEAIRQADPAAKVVAKGGASEPDFDIAVVSEIERQFPAWPWRNYLDAFSMHRSPAGKVAAPCCRPNKFEEFHTRVSVYGKPIWNTESLRPDLGFFHSTNAPSVIWGRPLFPFQAGELYTQAAPLGPERVAIALIETLGYGLGRFFYYDFRPAANPRLRSNHATALEYDDSVRPKGIALAAGAKLLDHSTGLGRLRTDDYTHALLFDRGGTPVVALYTDDNANRSLTLSGLTTSQVKLYDVMGNQLPLPNTTIQFGRQPVYLEGQGISVAAMRAAVEQGTIRNERDLVPPNLTINVGPRGSIPAGDTVRFRWGAADDTYTPGFADPNAIVFSYRVPGSPSNGSFSPWSATSFVDLSGLQPGDYVFEVKARDGAGNESPVQQRSFKINALPAIGYARPKGATPLRVPLVPAFSACGSPNRTHGAPLSYGSCNPPVQASSQLTVGSPDANGAPVNFIGNVLYSVIVGNASTPANEANVRLTVDITDVRRKVGLADYTGQLQVDSSVRATDRENGPSGTEPATGVATSFPVTVPCVSTASTTTGGTCALTTTFNSVVPGAIVESQRAIWQLGDTKVYDGGSDGVASTTPNTLFATQGLFVP